jgi:hypothetical protein
MIVVSHSEPLPDEISDHRAGPHPGSEPSRLRAGIDQRAQLVALGLGQSGPAARRLLGPEALRACCLEPLEPAIDGASGHIQVDTERNDGLAGQVAGHSFGPAPGFEVSTAFGFPVEVAQSVPLLGCCPSRTDRLTILRTSQDHLQTGRDRGTLIFARSSVNQRMDRSRRDPV